MTKRWVVACLLAVLTLADGASAQAVSPRGIYAVVPVENRIASAQRAARAPRSASSSAPFDQHAFLLDYYGSLLDNPAVAGLAVRVHWQSLSVGPPSDTDPAAGYDWSMLDDAFTSVSTWDSAHPSQLQKTIQLTVTPGFFTPSWVFDRMSSSGMPPCDPLFQDPPQAAPAACGSATFLDSEGRSTARPALLPLPWNSVYKSAWGTFLRALQGRYGANPAFASIAVAGPTAASAEMIVPHDRDALAHWSTLLKRQYPDDPTFQNSDKAFIVEWQAAIDLFGSIFNGVTLVAITGSGLPNFPARLYRPPPFAVPAGFAPYCGRVAMDCAAEASILAYFSRAGVGGGNARATQTSGVKVSHATNANLGLSGVKWLAATTAQSTHILGGGEFDTSFSEKPVEEGDGNNPEQALYNLLGYCFDGTTYGPQYGTSGILGEPPSFAPSNFLLTGPAPLHYLQIYDTDILYTSANADGTRVPIVDGQGDTVAVTAQELLDLASRQLLQVAD